MPPVPLAAVIPLRPTSVAAESDTDGIGPAGIVCTRSTRANCWAEANRWPGSLSSDFSTAATSDSGSPGRTCRRSGTGSSTCIRSTSDRVRALYGGRPASR